MKGIRGVSAVGGWVGQRPDHVAPLRERAGPPVGHDQRQRVGPAAGDVHGMDHYAVDVGAHLRERVERRLLLPPVELVPPRRQQGVEVVGVRSLRPARGDLLRPPRLVEASVQVVDRSVRDVDAELARRGLLVIANAGPPGDRCAGGQGLSQL